MMNATNRSFTVKRHNKTADAIERAIMAAASAPITVDPIDWNTDNRDDSGFAASDSTSRWIERTGERTFV